MGGKMQPKVLMQPNIPPRYFVARRPEGVPSENPREWAYVPPAVDRVESYFKKAIRGFLY
jgi:hypothetical protein